MGYAPQQGHGEREHRPERKAVDPPGAAGSEIVKCGDDEEGKKEFAPALLPPEKNRFQNHREERIGLQRDRRADRSRLFKRQDINIGRKPEDCSGCYGDGECPRFPGRSKPCPEDPFVV